MHSSPCCAKAQAEVVPDILGHANIGVTQNAYGQSWSET